MWLIERLRWLVILPAIPNRSNSPPRGGEYLYERIAGSISRESDDIAVTEFKDQGTAAGTIDTSAGHTKEGTVTVRERDTTAQRRVPIEDLPETLAALRDGNLAFDDL